MAYYSRAQWGARGVSLQGMSRPAPDVWIHHTVGEPGGDEARFMRETESFHINSRGMRAIAYSFIVMPSGNVYEGRGWDKVGGHTTNRNSTSHAVCFAGNFENHPPTQAALESAAAIIRDGIARGSIARRTQPTGGHRDVDATACPGRHLYARLNDLRHLVASGTGGAPSEEDDLPYSVEQLVEAVSNGVERAVSDKPKARDRIYKLARGAARDLIVGQNTDQDYKNGLAHEAARGVALELSDGKTEDLKEAFDAAVKRAK